MTLTEQLDQCIQINSMRTNGVNNPPAIDPELPHFSWVIETERRGTMQTAWQILVYEQRAPEILVWDSGKSAGSESCGVPYGGPALVSDTPYIWKVKIWTNYGMCSGFSSFASFRTGLGKSDWTARYIWDNTERTNRFLYFRKSFMITKSVKDAVVYATAHNDYQLCLNGESIGRGPARCDPYRYGQYCAYDIGELLQKGRNTFSALAHWHGVWSDSGTNAKPAFLLEARIHYADGTKDTIRTDDSWKLTGTPYIEEDPVYFGHYGGVRNRVSIQYDARKEIEQWNEITFQDGAWETATVVDRSDFNLYAQLVGEQTEMERLHPVSVWREGEAWFADFGMCLSGWPEIRLHGNNPSDRIKIQYWEVEKGWGDAGYDLYIAKGGEESFYVPFVRHTSFRLLEISGYKGALSQDDIDGIVACSYQDKQGDFTCSDERLNRVYEMSQRSGRQNYQQGIISVDANREQSPWTADSWNIGMGYLYNHAGTMAIHKIIKDYAAEQLDNGNFLTCSPAIEFRSEMMEWSLYWPMLLWEQYLFSGNGNLLADCYPNLVGFLAYVESTKSADTGLYNPPGWRSSDYAGGTIENGGENIVTNCHIVRAYEIGSEIAAVLGRSADETAYRGAADGLKDTINCTLLWGDEKYRTTPDSGQAHPLGAAWALRFHIVPDRARESVIRWLANQSEQYEIGGYGGDALYSGLYAAELGAVAARDFVRYDSMLASNNTNWESFGELSIDNMGNHAWTAYPSYLLQKYVGGIAPVSGGFAAFIIRPNTDGLTFASARVPTVKGMIRVSWKRQGGHFGLHAVIPGNTMARIYLPIEGQTHYVVKEGAEDIFRDGEYIEGVSGIFGGEMSGNHIILTVGNGSYSFDIWTAGIIECGQN